MTVQVQNPAVPLAKLQTGSGEVPIFITPEWRRCLTDAFQLINQQQAVIDSMQQRLTNGGL